MTDYNAPFFDAAEVESLRRQLHQREEELAWLARWDWPTPEINAFLAPYRRPLTPDND